LKKNSVVFTAVLFGLTAALAHAQAPTKIAVIDLGQAMQKTREGQKAGAELEAKFGPKQAEYEKRGQDPQALSDKLTKGQATMSDDAKKQLNAEITAKNTALKRFGEDSQNELQAEQEKIATDLQAKLSPIVTKYAIDNNFAVVMEIGNQGPVLWSATAINITDAIVQKYDEAHPVGADSAAKTAAPAAKAPAAAPKTPPAAPPVTKK
jgi:outer membrane protein